MPLRLMNSFVTVYTIALILEQTLPGTINKRRAAVSLLITNLAIHIMWYLYPRIIFAEFHLLMFFMTSVITLIVSFRGVRIRQHFFLTFLFLGLITTMSTLTYWIVSIASPITVPQDIVDLSLIAILFFICILTAKRRTLGNLFRAVLQIKASYKSILMGSTWLCALLSSNNVLIFHEYPLLPAHAFSVVLTAALILVVGIVFPLLITSKLSGDFYKNLSSVMDKQAQAQVALYESMAKNNEDLRRFMHDYGNLRLGILSSLKCGDIDGALAALDSGWVQDRARGCSFETGNTVLDALLSEKQAAAAGVSAEIVFNGAVPNDLLSLADICVIFGNALDNAIEACEMFSDGQEREIIIHSA